MESHYLRSSDYDYKLTCHLSKRGVVELLYFLFEVGWISHEDHDYVHEFMWLLKIEMDSLYPNWQPSDLKNLVKELRDNEN